MELALALLGLVVGFALSCFLWWLLNHRLVPDISFATGISTLPSASNEQVVYRIKIKNTGRRNIIDLVCRVHVHLPRMDALGPSRHMPSQLQPPSRRRKQLAAHHPVAAVRSSLEVLSREGLRSLLDQQALALDREIGKGRQLGFVAPRRASMTRPSPAQAANPPPA